MQEGRNIAAKVQGNTQGLKPSQLKALSRLSHRRYPNDGGYTLDQARELAALSASVGRQIGLLIDRQGRPRHVLVGGPDSILIPELARSRLGAGRLRGLRLLHTHVHGEPLTREDLMDLVFLRLDSLACLRLGPHGMPERVQVAHLLPGLPDLPESGTPPVSEVGAPLGEDEPYRVLDFPWDKVDVDFASLTEALEDEWSRSEEAETRVTMGEESRALLVHVSNLPKSAQDASLRELTALAETAGVQVAGTVSQRMAKPNPKTVLGKGKLADLEVAALNARAGLVLFDRELTAAQMRNLADITERKVLDRTQLILDIFAQHATSRAGKLQVEKAQMEYTLPRLVGRNKALSRLTGGIGGRGPGETKLELDRRKIRDRMTRIKDELKKLRKQRGAIRARRAKAGVPVVALVGYTNAGKSTLLNALTQSEVLAENKLFATLDPTTRRLRVPEERELILTDTVGFIRELPEELKEAFQATLEELESADLLVHVADAGHLELEEQVEAVEDILRDMDLHETPRITVLNKWDTVDEETREMRRNRYPDAIPVSAKTGAGLDYLSREIASRVDWQVG
ncbi:GTPase HflX [Oceanidesulfovibrio indonesiensis]|uniref:GTPase HflX n=1 Tax=Oceanidesulfovibrio indonesiensis TaxID=54767 RepID=A0A7M3MAD2_9BACT|nr:GTPase HflX [Oceanidesulfovibrio indonesiensis]